MRCCVLMCILFFCETHSQFFSTPIVEIGQGRLRGVRNILGVNQYFGIPYATSVRFQPPKPPRKWKGIFNAVSRYTSCAQAVTFITHTNEDCLQLDVYTPEHAKSGDNIPVFVFLHGGAYYYGNKAITDPEFLVTKNIVAVIINYRLTVFGFLCMNGAANLGLKDQSAALKWVKKNIAAFGGDPNNVCLAGQSAGASAASMHMLSKHSKGLFHKVIIMSGTPLTPWAFNAEPLRPALEDANKIADAQDEEDLYHIFTTYPMRQILRATLGVSYNSRYFRYSPCVDSNLTDPFFSDTPYEIIKSGNFNKVPVLMGMAEVEGMLFYGINRMSTLTEWDGNFIERLPSVFSWCSYEDREKIARKIRSYYFGKRAIDDSSKDGIMRFYSDWMGHATFDAFADLLTRYSHQPVYKYVFSYEGDRNFAKMVGRGGRMKGATHSDDLFYVFKPGGLPLLLSNEDRLFINRFTTLLANFMRYGNPTPRRTPLLPAAWPATTVNSSYTMHLGRPLEVTRGPWLKDRFFLDLLCTYGLKGYVPCDSKEQCNLNP
ncbi:esterase FE4-like [Plodia interpunctella]|uniref:esterase FE4-like n=1 Tax=Plodia interpunctella TaxID=58824 RepID=UPI002368E2FB|nr:esterase FE4-like [Plodia interpunctella]